MSDCSYLLYFAPGQFKPGGSQNAAIQSNYREDVALNLHLFSRIMRAIRIIKQKQNANEAATEQKKPVAPSTQKIARTIKSWIEESEQRRRNLPRSLTALGVVILIAFAVATAQSPAASNIKVTIATTDGFLGPPAMRYRVGEQIPVTIMMTNTSNEPQYTCISSDVYCRWESMSSRFSGDCLVAMVRWSSQTK